MLRTSLRSVRAAGGAPVAAALGRQCRVSSGRQLGFVTRRYFADDKRLPVEYPKPKASATNTSPPTTKPTPVESTPTAPLETPAADPADPVVEAAAPPPPPPKPKKGILRRLRNLITTLSVLGLLSFGAGVYYARIDDRFHDLFTEYVPLGEQAVVYLEELDFRKRFPDGWTPPARGADGKGPNVVVPASSGASWRVADGGEISGRRSSAVDKKAPKAVAVLQKETEEHKAAEKKEEVKAEENGVDLTKAGEKQKVVAAKDPKTTTESAEAKELKRKKKAEKDAGFREPEVDEPSRFPPIAPIDPLKVNDATEAVVQDLVRMLNDLIAVINADGAHGRYGTTITKAKGDLAKVGGKVRAIKAEAEKRAAAQVKAKADEFTAAAEQLVTRAESAMVAQEAQFRREFEEEMTRARGAYDEKTQLLLERERKLQEEKLNTALLEQAIALQKEFLGKVKRQVEAEREGRLGRLEDLSSKITELEKLTAGWNDVVDMNIQTQQLHVAVEAVRAALESEHGDERPRPFIRELVALKQIANGDGVVDAAIASINPSAYQKGVASPAQLVDRFRRVATEVRKASLLPEDAGVASHATSWALSKVLFKKDGLVAGEDVESVLTRTQTFLEEGDLDSAAREMNGLQGWAKMLSRDWLAEVRKVLEVQQALDVIATEARLQSLRVE